MTGGDASFSATRGVKFVDGKVFPAFTILNGSEGPGAAPIVRAVAMTRAALAPPSTAVAAPPELSPGAGGGFGAAPPAVGAGGGVFSVAAPVAAAAPRA